jgi:hypothetical protein
MKLMVVFLCLFVSIASYAQEQTMKVNVVKGDTLQDLSTRLYGTSKRWQEIYEMNKLVIPDSNRLEPGIELVVTVPSSTKKVKVIQSVAVVPVAQPQVRVVQATRVPRALQAIEALGPRPSKSVAKPVEVVPLNHFDEMEF